MTCKILVLPGDGIGPEVVAAALDVLDALRARTDFTASVDSALVGGASFDATGTPLTDDMLARARSADAVLLGAVGGPQWDKLERPLRPEQGLLRLRAGLGVFANLRPAILYPQLAAASTLEASVVSGLDLMIVRELTGDIYFGQPRGIVRRADGLREGYNTMRYDEAEIRRVARVAFGIAQRRSRRLCSVDKANVLETTELWRDVVTETAADFPEVSLQHMYVDNAAMQLVRNPKQFDVLLTGNMFGDILSDLASMLTGSIGMLPSASLNEAGAGLYEPIHGSAPDIAGRDVANPLATILSVAMMLRYSLDRADLAARVEAAVSRVLDSGLRTADIHTPGTQLTGTRGMGAAVAAAL